VGGMAEVFKAKVMREEGFEKLFAIKRILPSIAEDDEFIKMFIDEAKIAVQLTHANIAQILDLGKVGDAYFIAMEYVHGKDTRSVTERMKKQGQTLGIPMCCYIMMKVCEGLDYAHNKKDSAGRELNLVHRDVSPQNVLLSFDGEVKLIDFGIAKAANKAAKTQAGILKGKFGYMSPEQVRGLPLDRRSDVFSAGIVLYELLTGERLFLGESDFSTLEKVRNVEIMPPSTFNRNIPEELEQIVLKALAREVEDRYQTAMELHDDLQSFMYTFGDLFGRKEQAAFLREHFPDEYEAGIQSQPGGDQEKAPERASRRGASAPPPPPRRSAPPPPPRLSKGAGLRGSVPPPPPKARTSTPPPPPPKKTMAGMPAPGAPAPEAEAAAPAPEPEKPAVPPEPAPPSQPSTPPPPPKASVPPSAGAPSSPEGGGPSGLPRPGAPAGTPPRPQAAKPSLAGPPTARPAAADAAADEEKPAAEAPAGLDMEWDDDEMETQIYDKLPEDEQVLGPMEEKTPAPAASSGRAEPAQAPAGEIVIPQAPPKQKSSAGLILGLMIVAGVIIGGLVIAFAVMSKKPATLVLAPQPDDVTITLDGDPIEGPFPKQIDDLEPGSHTLVASHDEYETLELEMELESGATMTPAIKMVRKKPKGTGFILETEPIGASVVINNRTHPDKTPVTVSDLKPGTYTIRVEKAGFLPFSTEVKVKDGKLAQMEKVVLDPKSVNATITSDPSEARIKLITDGRSKEIGETPKEVELDPSKRYALELELEGHETWSKKLEMPKGDNKISIDAALSPVDEVEDDDDGKKGGKASSGARKAWKKKKKTGGGGGGKTKKYGYLSVSTHPWTIVYVDKKKVKNTPLMRYKLPVGKHSVTLLNNDFNIKKTYTVIIAEGQETRISKNLSK
jgi:serine/threonine protein kinase